MYCGSDADERIDFGKPEFARQIILYNHDDDRREMTLHEACSIRDITLSCGDIVSLDDMRHLPMESCRLEANQKVNCRLRLVDACAECLLLQSLYLDDLPLTAFDPSGFSALSLLSMSGCDVESLGGSGVKNLSHLDSRKSPAMKEFWFRDWEQRRLAFFERDDHIVVRFRNAD